MPGAAVEGGGAEEFLGDFVAPVHEGAFGELHDVALVDEGDGIAVVVDGVLDRSFDDSCGAFFGDWFEAESGGVGEADFFEPLGEVVFEELLELGVVIGAFFKLDAGVDVFGVFAEDDHIGEVWALDR